MKQDKANIINQFLEDHGRTNGYTRNTTNPLMHNYMSTEGTTERIFNLGINQGKIIFRYYADGKLQIADSLTARQLEAFVNTMEDWINYD